MKYHIVQINEHIQDISRKYNVSVEEIVKLNRHINNLDSIIPGMKIRLPVLNDEISDELKNNFLDIEKYYPKVEDFKEVNIEKKLEDKKEDEEKAKLPSPYTYQPYQQYYQAPLQPLYPSYQGQFYPPPYQPYYFNREIVDSLKPLNHQEPQMVDLTIPQLKAKVKPIDSTLCEQPAFCDPILLTDFNSKLKIPYDKTAEQLFQKPLFNPPYPCGVDIKETYNEKQANISLFDEDVKEIKVDLRDFVKKHTKITKKKIN